jgi:microcystin-dependent protein
MAEPFLAEIRLMSFVFPPKGWALCNGQLLPINQNQALFSLLGTTYGGNGQTNFALPDLRGRVPIHVGAGHSLGERAGSEAVTLSVAQLPAHVHAGPASTANASTGAPAGASPAVSKKPNYAETSQQLAGMTSTSLAGGSQPHENRQPFLTVSFCIALQGIFPSPN